MYTSVARNVHMTIQVEQNVHTATTILVRDKSLKKSSTMVTSITTMAISITIISTTITNTTITSTTITSITTIRSIDAVNLNMKKQPRIV